MTYYLYNEYNNLLLVTEVHSNIARFISEFIGFEVKNSEVKVNVFMFERFYLRTKHIHYSSEYLEVKKIINIGEKLKTSEITLKEARKELYGEEFNVEKL
jgi:hypothetical protein